MENEEQWERHATWWQREFASGADSEYEDQILPMVTRHLAGARRVLDIGCGEGQVARRIASDETQVVGLDPSWSQVVAAHERGNGPRYARSRAEALPCRSAAFDAVLVCAAFEHVDAYETAIQEVARVLEPGGLFVLILCHPLLQSPGSGWVDDQILGEQYWRVGAYLREDRAFDEVAPGVELLFIHRPLSAYVHALGNAGLLIEDMEEPAPTPELIAETGGCTDGATIPRVLLLRSRHLRS